MKFRTYKAAFVTQTKALFRLPAYWVPTLIFPTMLFAMFGSGLSGTAASEAIASFVVYGVVGVAFYQFGVSIAQDRESQWERYRRTLPGAWGPYMVSQLLSAFIFVVFTALLVVVVGFMMSQPTLSATTTLALLASLIFISIPFTLLGFALGYWTNAKSAVAVANLIYLPLAYIGGLWLPPNRLPDTVASISVYTPTYHAGVVGRSLADGIRPEIDSLLWLVGFSIIFALLAQLGYQRDERKRYP